jgi:hypothetical protein
MEASVQKRRGGAFTRKNGRLHRLCRYGGAASFCKTYRKRIIVLWKRAAQQRSFAEKRKILSKKREKTPFFPVFPCHKPFLCLYYCQYLGCGIVELLCVAALHSGQPPGFHHLLFPGGVFFAQSKPSNKEAFSDTVAVSKRRTTGSADTRAF